MDNRKYQSMIPCIYTKLITKYYCSGVYQSLRVYHLFVEHVVNSLVTVFYTAHAHNNIYNESLYLLGYDVDHFVIIM